jgi:hypothetical protein
MLLPIGMITQASVVPHVVEAVVGWVGEIMANLQTSWALANESPHDKAGNSVRFTCEINLQMTAVRIDRQLEDSPAQPARVFPVDKAVD